ncbi:Rha family transcriptional regulator [Methylobacterium tarhaniae]|uniref:Rha family transcriptional regulator n=1 Tax=Methylobacterium tarhaniae TaxID=1187852 RepID=UPI003CFEAD22
MSDEDISFASAALSTHEARMSSLEIAELTGKLHKNVLADIRRMLTELGLQPADFSARYRDEKGEVRTCAHLPKRETMILMTGYSIPMRAKVVDRWAELEAKLQAAPPVSQQTEQLLAPIMAPLAAMSQMLQTLIQLNTAQLQQAPAKAQRSRDSFRSTKPVMAKRRTEVEANIEENQEWPEMGRLGRKPTFNREDVSAVLTLTRKGMSAGNIAKALNLSTSVVEHIRLNPVWAEGVLRKWGL